jgi:hypothetical protein
MIWRGIWLLARGRAAGIKEFGNSVDALTASLAPLIAFPLVGAGITATNGQPKLAVIAFLARLCAVLAVPVITYEFARFTKRESLWLRTTAALDWSFWLIVPLLVAAGFIGTGLVAAGLSVKNAEYAAMALMIAYMLWLQWFTVRNGLEATALQAAGLVLANTVVLGALSAAPALIFQIMPGF